VKHKSLKMLQLLYQFLMTQLCRIFVITLWIVHRFEKKHSTNLKHCFTVSMTAHSISILSELKMSSFGPYTGVKTCSPSIALSFALCWRPCQSGPENLLNHARLARFYWNVVGWCIMGQLVITAENDWRGLSQVAMRH